MTADFEISRDGWRTGGEDAESLATSSVRLSVGSSIVTRNVSKRGGGESDSISTSLLPLAQFIAKGWWALLYEPLRPIIDVNFRARHRLDSGTRGYAFPAMALWSSGDNALLADWASFEVPFASISFVEPSPLEPVELARDATEVGLMDFVETVLERVARKDRQAEELAASWSRIRETVEDAEETAYCVAAGRLGLDPYDPDSPDLEVLSRGISNTLFADAAEVLELDDIAASMEWLRLAEQHLKLFPEINITEFGCAPADDLRLPAYAVGEQAALQLRASTGFSVENPREMVTELLGPATLKTGQIAERGPNGISAISHRASETMKLGIVARSARQRRFRACAAAYMAWTAEEGEDRAATLAYTRRQQASRAFAAELLAPQSALSAMAPRFGFDSEDIQSIASRLVCPYDTVMWQAIRAGVSLRGVDPHRNFRPMVITAQPSQLL